MEKKYKILVENEIMINFVIDELFYIEPMINAGYDIDNWIEYVGIIDENKKYKYVNKKLIELSIEEINSIDYFILPQIKDKKIKQLIEDFNKSKKIILQNGNTIIIEYNTPERDLFLEKLEKVSQESILKNVVLTYQQKINSSFYNFSALPEVWSYIFNDLFVKNRTKNGINTGYKENVRETNKTLFDFVLNKIKIATKISDVNNITWNFYNPDGIVIDISDKAKQMLNDTSVSEYVKQAIRDLIDENGEIHLIIKL
jgi:hypothetical protein